MKRLLFLLILLTTLPAFAEQVFSRKYATATTVDFCLYTADATGLQDAASCATGDVTIMKDEGTPANTGSCFADEGTCYSLALTGTEMTAARVVIVVDDQDATEAWLDKAIVIETYGNASATHALNDISTSDVETAVGTALGTYDPPTKTEMDSAFAGLNDLSAAEVNAEVDTALSDYDPPTKAELDSGLAGLNDVSSGDVETAVGTALGTYDPPTKTEMDSAFAALNDVSSSDVETACDTSLATYDAPTATEMTAAFTAIKGASWSSSTDTLEKIRDASGGGGGTSTPFRAW